MSKHEAELRRRVANSANSDADIHDSIYDTMVWFLEAVGAQAHLDGGPKPDLSWFEREFLKDNTGPLP
jgi:hypothetical protein